MFSPMGRYYYSPHNIDRIICCLQLLPFLGYNFCYLLFEHLLSTDDSLQTLLHLPPVCIYLELAIQYLTVQGCSGLTPSPPPPPPPSTGPTSSCVRGECVDERIRSESQPDYELFFAALEAFDPHDKIGVLRKRHPWYVVHWLATLPAIPSFPYLTDHHPSCSHRWPESTRGS